MSRKNLSRPNVRGAVDFSSRRTFLKAMSGGATLAPFIPLLEAQAAAAPTRLIVVTGHNGWGETNKWYPTGSGANYSMGSTCNSLEPYKKDIIFFKDFEGRYASDEAGVHPMASANLLTGSPATRPDGGTIFERQDATRATSISIDQYVAKLIGKGTPHESLVMGCGAEPYSAGDHIGGSVSYRGASDPILAEPDVFVVFKRLFANASNAVAAPTDKVNLRAGDDRSILDAVSKNLGWLNGRVGAADKRRLESHLDGLREMEKRLPPLGKDEGPPVELGQCVAPKMPPANDATMFQTRQAARFLPLIVQTQIDMMLAAMACDQTRVGLLQIGVTTGLWPPQFMGLNKTLHDLSHNFNADMSRFTQRCLKEGFAYLLGRLNEIQEGGVPMMRNVAAFWTNEFGDGDAHQGSPMPIIAAGQAGGKWQTGRYVVFNNKRRHSDFLVSVARTFGADITKFGTDPTAGPLPELGV
jgi:hypothetical protein